MFPCTNSIRWPSLWRLPKSISYNNNKKCYQENEIKIILMHYSTADSFQIIFLLVFFFRWIVIVDVILVVSNDVSFAHSSNCIIFFQGKRYCKKNKCKGNGQSDEMLSQMELRRVIIETFFSCFFERWWIEEDDSRKKDEGVDEL